MSENVSTQLPSSPPNSPPVASRRSKIWQGLSFLLLAGGMLMLGVAGWLYYRQYQESIQPPPARIVQMAPLDLTATPAPSLSPAPSPTPNPTGPQHTGDTLALPSPTPPPAPTKPPVPAPPPTEIALSLADNPLPVVEEESPLPLPPPPDPAETIPEIQSVNPFTPSGAKINRITAPSIELDSKVIEVGWQVREQNGVPVNVWVVADYAAGWHTNSMLPGQGGNVVLSAHHNIKGEVFRRTVDLEPGDIVTLYDDAGQAYHYVIEDKFIVKDKGEPDAVRRANAKWIGPFNDERLTLVTCWPYNNNTHRVIVIGKPASQEQLTGP